MGMMLLAPLRTREHSKKWLHVLYQQHKEDEEDVGEKICRSQDGVGPLNVPKVEVAQDHPEEGEDRVTECSKVVDLQRE